jgi:hypothetical protein
MAQKLENYIGHSQLACMRDLCKGEEGGFFIDKMADIESIINSMPKTYETDGQGKDAVAHLKYFTNTTRFFVTERDIEDEQLQAFGLVVREGEYPEFGYISIKDIIENGGEIDLHFTPKTLFDVERAFYG